MLPDDWRNNLKQIARRSKPPTEVMIVTEMIHDARIVRIGGKHLPSSVRKWLGDSVGHWEGDTLVVGDDQLLQNKTRFRRGRARTCKVTERFHRGSTTWRFCTTFTVEDPLTWARPWTGEYTWSASNERMFEYACHENNYALGGILRGARVARSKQPQQNPEHLVTRKVRTSRHALQRATFHNDAQIVGICHKRKHHRPKLSRHYDHDRPDRSGW